MPNVSQGMAAMIMFCSALVRLSALILMHLRKREGLSFIPDGPERVDLDAPPEVGPAERADLARVRLLEHRHRRGDGVLDVLAVEQRHRLVVDLVVGRLLLALRVPARLERRDQVDGDRQELAVLDGAVVVLVRLGHQELELGRAEPEVRVLHERVELVVRERAAAVLVRLEEHLRARTRSERERERERERARARSARVSRSS